MSRTSGQAKQPTIGDRQDFLPRLSLLQAEAGQLGLFKTMHALHEANRVGGFELAAAIEADMKAATVKEAGRSSAQGPSEP